jgi:Zn-dependent protease with chaperone function
MTAIVGHELGHFRGLDTQFSQKFYPIYRGTADAVTALVEGGGDASLSIPLLPAAAVLSYFLDSFSMAESDISRRRELVADQCGSEATSVREMAVSLVKVHAFAPIWDGFDDTAEEVLKKGQAFVNASLLFAEAATGNANPERLLGLDDRRLPHPTDSHPPLAARLQSLGLSISDVTDAALLIEPSESAASAIDNIRALEEELTDAYQALLVRERGIDMPDVEEGQSADGV